MIVYSGQNLDFYSYFFSWEFFFHLDESANKGGNFPKFRYFLFFFSSSKLTVFLHTFYCFFPTEKVYLLVGAGFYKQAKYLIFIIMTNSTSLCLEIKAKCTVQFFNDNTKKNLIS